MDKELLGESCGTCWICGAEVKLRKSTTFAAIRRGGGGGGLAGIQHKGEPDVPDDDPGAMGWYPIGPKCRKQLEKSHKTCKAPALYDFGD